MVGLLMPPDRLPPVVGENRIDFLAALASKVSDVRSGHEGVWFATASFGSRTWRGAGEHDATDVPLGFDFLGEGFDGAHHVLI